MTWLTGSVQGTLLGYWLLCLFSCTFPAHLVPRELMAALLPPTSLVCPHLPFLSFSLRSYSLFALCLGFLGGSRAATQGVGLGSLHTSLSNKTSSRRR
jgi:hypothetical protein